MSRFDRYLSIPFKDGGRGFDGSDCFGLYVLVLVNEAGIIPIDPGVSFAASPIAVSNAVSAVVARGDWVKVDRPQVFDGVVMTGIHLNRGVAGKAELHIGCMIDDRTMLHTELHSGPRVMAIDNPEVAGRIKGFYRPRALIDRVAA